MLTLAAILLPFSAGLEPAQGVMLFAVIYCTGTYGGAITAILFNIPGAPENAPTAFDGYPMTKKGLAGKAVGAAVLCSAVGGTASALLMMAATEPLAHWAIRNIGPPEIFASGIFWTRCGFISWRQHHLERMDVSSSWSNDCDDWARSSWWYKSLQLWADRSGSWHCICASYLGFFCSFRNFHTG